MSARRKNWDPKTFRAEIKKWKKTFDPSNYEKKSDIPIPTLESFYSSYVSRNTIKVWKNTNPKLWEIFQQEVKEYIGDNLTQLLCKRTNITGIIFLMKSTMGYRDQPEQEIAPITINLTTSNKGKNSIKRKPPTKVVSKKEQNIHPPLKKES